MGRQLDTRDIRDLLRDNLEHPRWDEVAERCLTCGNCTMACPTCFCTAVEDANDLGTDPSSVHRRLGLVLHRRLLAHPRRRRPADGEGALSAVDHPQAGTWHDQFGSSGCVGCGRCITWCPVGIDITEEVAAIRATGEENQ